MFTAALFTVANIWKQPKCPSADEWIRKMCYIHIQWSTTQPKKNEIWSNVGGPRKYHAQQNKREREILYDITHMWSLKKKMNVYSKIKKDAQV